MEILGIMRKSNPCPSQTRPLQTKKEVNEIIEEALNIRYLDMTQLYRVSSNKVPKHPETGNSRVLAYRKDDEKNGLFLITRTGISKQTLLDEFGVLALCKGHENFVTFKETFFNDSRYLAITEVPNGLAIELNSLLRKVFKAHRVSVNGADPTILANELQPVEWREDYILYILKEVCKALEYLHDRNIVCRDVVADNIVVDLQGGVKISGLLFATVLTVEEPVVKSVRGKVHYMSPEAMRGWDYNQLADMWSYGIFCLKVAENRVPFSRYKDHNEVMSNVIRHRAPELNPDINWSADFRKMHDSLMQHNVNERASSSKVLKQKVWLKAAQTEIFSQFVKSLYETKNSL